MVAYAVTALGFLIYLVAVWFLGPLLGLQGRDLWILRGGLALIGLAGFIVGLWFYLKIKKEKGSAAGASSQNKGTEIDNVLREAELRLKSSNLGRSASLQKLPIVFVLGEAGTGKTSSVLHSGLEADLLAGQVHEANNVAPVPTRTANVWYAKNTAFLEANGKAVAEAGWWSHLLARLKPGKVGALKGGQPPRAAVVCFSCETFLQPSATGTIDAPAGAVRYVRAALEEIARVLGMSFPVYILFTKADRIPFFTEFTRNLSDGEAAQVLGVTLPLRPGNDIGVYAEQETQRLNATFNNLILALADKRPDLLAREHDSQKLGAIYEFPREFRKLRGPLVQSLVDICRPSQLRATPFLRGFYFSGVRPVFVTEVAQPAPSQPSAAKFTTHTDATGIFKAGAQAARAIPQPQVVGSRKVPQWTFLTHFFADVLLQDRLAMAATGANSRTNTLRRVLLISGAVICLLLSIAFVTSYAGNRALETQVAQAAREIAAEGAASGPIPPLATLQKLETLRQAVERLSVYRREGPPLHLRWGLYSGVELTPPARSLYFKRFRELLFGSTQTALADFLKGIPSTPGPGDDYGLAYDSLKAYLITTSNHDKSSRMFLSPVLLKRWGTTRSPDVETLALVRNQFDFYSEELAAENPFASENDAVAVARARRYLSQFAGTERVYQFMLAEASRKGPAVAFNRQFPGSAEVLIDNREVQGAYTKAGWSAMQDAIKNADRFFSGEQWVLGEQGALGVDRAKLEQQLRDRYTTDFIDQWRQFLNAATVVRYTSVKDAAAKLNKLSSNQSPLLALLCVVSQNTGVEAQQIKNAFQAVQFVVPPATCAQRYVDEANAGYMQSLLGLDALLEQIGNSPGTPNSALTDQAGASALQAKVLTRQLAQKFQIDPLNSTVQKLLEDPITGAESLIRNFGPAELNAKGKTFCTQFAELTNKYPFNSNAKAQATLQEVNAIFQPQQGALWAFYESSLRNQMTRQGTQFVAKADSPIGINPAFLNFWNRAAAFAEAAYPENSPQPRLAYTLKPYRMEGIETTLAVDGQTVASAASAPRQFVWSGSPNSEVKLTGSFGRGQDLEFFSYQGVWAPFQLFADADKSVPVSGGYTLEWVPRQGRSGRAITLPNGTPLTIRFDLEGKTASLFQKDFLTGLRCVSEIAR